MLALIDSGAATLAAPILLLALVPIIAPLVKRPRAGYNRAEIPASAWADLPTATPTFPRPYDHRHRVPASDFDSNDNWMRELRRARERSSRHGTT